MSNNSSSTSHLGNILQARNNSLGLNLPQKQAFTVPSNLRSEVVIIPSTSSPAWGSYFIFDVKERNCIISDLLLNFSLSLNLHQKSFLEIINPFQIINFI